MGLTVFRQQSKSVQIRAFLGRLYTKAKPKYIICDKGSQFWCIGFKAWCKRKTIKPRFGAVGKHGSIAVMERFILSFKDESLRRIVMGSLEGTLRGEIDRYLVWFNRHRPHTALGGKTPEEAYRRIAPANGRPRWEPRERWPRDACCARPKAKLRADPGVRLELVVTYLDRQKHLPLVSLKKAA